MLGKAGISQKEEQKDAIVYDDSDGCVAAYWIQHKAHAVYL